MQPKGGDMKDWIKANPNKIGVVLWAFYSWAKAFAAARLGFQFLPETDALIMAALTALGVHSVSRNPK